jgi:hypothetical protein
VLSGAAVQVSIFQNLISRAKRSAASVWLIKVNGNIRERCLITMKEHNAMRMQEIEIHDYARQLLEAHGGRSVAEAAQKASNFEKEGNAEEADNWRRIEAVLVRMRGPHAS